VATTTVVMDLQERMMSIAQLQHVPFNEDGIVERFTNTAYQALK
jgi:hypothetical protein